VRGAVEFALTTGYGGVDKIRVGVIFGGRSSEHEISLRSALAVIAAFDPARYEVIAVGITRAGRWQRYQEPLKLLDALVRERGELADAQPAVNLLPEPMAAGDVAPALESALNRQIDVAFPLLHGSFGEDGTIQGLLEMAGIPYVGPGVLGSAIGMDKAIQKRLLREAGIAVVEFAVLQQTDVRRDPGRAAAQAAALGYPVFVKPNALGSSIGTSKVKSAAELTGALADAFQYDRTVLIEAACEGREFECSVLGNDQPQASLPGEVIVDRAYDFYSYQSKYLDPNGATYAIPARLPPAAVARIKELALGAFKALSLRGMARVDFLASADLARIYVNEVNTIPGFTSISMYPKLWEVSGLPLPRLLDRLVDLALEEHRARAALKVSFAPGR